MSPASLVRDRVRVRRTLKPDPNGNRVASGGLREPGVEGWSRHQAPAERVTPWEVEVAVAVVAVVAVEAEVEVEVEVEVEEVEVAAVERTAAWKSSSTAARTCCRGRHRPRRQRCRWCRM